MPVFCNVPPVDPKYQFTTPALDVAPKFTVPVPQREPGVVPVIDGNAFTVTTKESYFVPEQTLLPDALKYIVYVVADNGAVLVYEAPLCKRCVLAWSEYQLYVKPGTPIAARVNVAPAHTVVSLLVPVERGSAPFVAVIV